MGVRSRAMPLRNAQLARLRRRPVPAWWRDASTARACSGTTSRGHRPHSPLGPVRGLLRREPRRGRERPLDAVEPVVGPRPHERWSAGDRRGCASAGDRGRRDRAPEATALRRAHARVRVVHRHPAHAVGVRARDGAELRVQRGVPTGALPRPRRAPVVVQRHRRQGREPAAQRRTAPDRRADPRRAADAAEAARRELRKLAGP